MRTLKNLTLGSLISLSAAFAGCGGSGGSVTGVIATAESVEAANNEASGQYSHIENDIHGGDQISEHSDLSSGLEEGVSETPVPTISIVPTPVPTIAPEIPPLLQESSTPSDTPAPTPTTSPELTPTPVAESQSTDSGTCGEAYEAGQSYAAGDVVSNQNYSYRCEVAGWCSDASGTWAYEPGVGVHWQVAWTQLGACGESTAQTPEPTPSPTPELTPEPSATVEPSPLPVASPEITPAPSVPSEAHANVVATYFVEWGVYGRNYHVADMPAEKLTHVIYGFLPICGPNDSLANANPAGHSALVAQCEGKEDYTVVIHDTFAALEKAYPGDSWEDAIKGNFGQLIKMKTAHPHIKVVPSIGGWTLSDPFFSMASDPTKRATFVKSAVDFIRTYDFFDGLDIDWEFPGGGGANASLGGPEDFQAYADLMRDLRAELDILASETGREYELTSAIGVGPAKIAAVNYAEAQMYMDYIFGMTYDYYGPWNTQLGHHTALYDYPENANEGYASADSIDQLIAAGVPAEKLVLGVAKYGRGWSNVEGGGSGTPLQGTGTYASSGGVNAMQGTWEAGILDYKDIEENYLGGPDGMGINGFSYYYDDTAEAAYLWNPSTGEFISFDNKRSVMAKGEYAKSRGLGGLFSWEIDADNGTIMDAMVESLK